MTPEVRLAIARRRQLHAAITGRKAGRRYYFAPQQVPRGPMLSYTKDLLSLVAFMRREAEVRILDALPGWVRESDALHGRTDAAGDDAAKLFGGIRLGLERGAFSTTAVKEIAAKAANRTADAQKEALKKQLRAAIGVEVPIFDKHLGSRVDAFTSENVGLIQSIPQQSLAQVQALVLRGLTSGDRSDEMAEDIEERFDVSESRAALIARDQTLKFFASLNETRQTDLGITHFTWATANNEKVCDECGPLDGRRFPWDSAPGGGPGRIHPNCCCSADPDVEALLDSL